MRPCRGRGCSEAVAIPGRGQAFSHIFAIVMLCSVIISSLLLASQMLPTFDFIPRLELPLTVSEAADLSSLELCCS